jgi:hypothetical protein
LRAILLAIAAVVLLSRVPLFPGQLFSFDDVNLAYAVGEIDVRKSQPHPPGYPLFVLQMRALQVLRVVRPESALQILSIAATIAAAAAMILGMRSFAGPTAAVCAAALLLFHPSNWYASLTSALRVQLALVSISVAAACWRAWRGDRRWALFSAAILAAGAGIRPEAGAILFPLWCVSVWRGASAWRDRLLALAILGVGIAAWLLPLAAASGGIAEFARVTWHYLQDQAALTSALFGAAGGAWQRTAAWLMVWGFCGAAVWPLLMRNGTGFSRNQWWFLALWTVPGILFALLVHVADPGQTLAIVPAMCLLNGTLAARAKFAALPPPVLIAFAAAGIGVVAFGPAAGVLLFALAGMLTILKRFQSERTWAPAATALAPELVMYFLIFGALPPLPAPPALRDFASGFHAMSLTQIRETVSLDDRLLQQIARSITPDRQSFVIWDGGDVSWRKIAYYLPGTPVIVLDRRLIAKESAPVATCWKGPRLVWRVEDRNPLELRLPRQARIVWARGPATIVTVEDLPETAGSLTYGAYRIEW